MSDPRLHLLVVEDNAALSRNIADFLEGSGHVLDFAATGPEGLRLALQHRYDVVVLDLMLPGLDGRQVCRELRARSERYVPVLMLTAQDALEDKLQGFASGADDYLTKPFALEELHARCIALSRRARAGQDVTLRVGTLSIDRRTQQVTRAGQPVPLQRAGYTLLLALAEASPRTVTRSELMERLWGDAPPDSDALRSHVYALRQALDKPFDRPMLVTVHGVGFRLESDT